MARSPKAGAAKAPDKRTAVVVVHGMGEQRPMETLWGLVEALWTRDGSVTGPREFTYSKPDEITGSFELRRITTSRGAAGKRFDFFELYWAHLMHDNTIAAVLASVQMLLVRRPSSVPPRLMSVWLLAIGVMVVIGVILALSAISVMPHEVRDNLPVIGRLSPLFLLVPVVLAAGLKLLGQVWVGPVAGDAARYLNAAPPNVAARQSIREAAVDLIEKLHAAGVYDRIIVIGHSLGTVVAYDALTFAWGRVKGEDLSAAHAASPAAMAALNALEKAALTLDTATGTGIGAARVAYREAQRVYFAELSKLTRADGVTPVWLVSDFVSTAAPLSKGDVLMARDAKGFEARLKRREYPACPPVLEKLKPPRFSYPARDPLRAPHHAAVFAPTLWTNIFFETGGIVLGDVIAGRCAPLFGRGVLDVRLKRGGSVFRHLDYWKDPAHAEPATGKPHPWITALRRAVNLNGQPDRDLWGALADAEEVAADVL